MTPFLDFLVDLLKRANEIVLVLLSYQHLSVIILQSSSATAILSQVDGGNMSKQKDLVRTCNRSLH